MVAMATALLPCLPIRLPWFLLHVCHGYYVVAMVTTWWPWVHGCHDYHGCHGYYVVAMDTIVTVWLPWILTCVSVAGGGGVKGTGTGTGRGSGAWFGLVADERRRRACVQLLGIL